MNYKKISGELFVISEEDYNNLTPDTQRDYYQTTEDITHKMRGGPEDHNYVWEKINV